MPVIAFVMRFYSLSLREVMEMRFRTFLSLNREANKLQAKEYRELCAISLIPRQNNKYYQNMFDMYSAIIDPKVKDLPPAPPRPALDAGSVEGKNAVIRLFARGKPGGR